MLTDTIKTGSEEDTDIKLQKSMLAMLVFGIGEVLGGFFIGQVIDS